MEILKRCSKCKAKKELSEFHKNKHKKDGYADYCKLCNSAEFKSRHHKLSEYRLMYIHNVTPEVYNEMFEKQKGRCLICGRHQNELKKALCVDHDHLTGKNRGLLCVKCNLRLGVFNDNIENLKSAIVYLEGFK